MLNLVKGWNKCSAGKTIYRLVLKGPLEQLPEPLPLTLFRVVQECLTNIAKHAMATEVIVTLTVPVVGKTHVVNKLTLEIIDNGSAKQLPFEDNSGIGLLGMRERIEALGGQLNLKIANPSGLIVQVSVPMHPLKD